MKIPYFYLEAGNIQIFQPTNQNAVYDDDAAVIDCGVLIYTRAEPALSGNKLFLNGEQRDASFRFLSDRRGNFSKFVKALQNHNGEQDV